VNDAAIGAALVIDRVVEERSARCRPAAFGLVGPAAYARAFVFGLPSVRRPEHVFFLVEDMRLRHVVLGKGEIALAQFPLARGVLSVFRLVPAENVPLPFPAVAVTLKLANAHFAEFFSGAAEAVLVLFADLVERVDGRPYAWFGHWSIT